MLLKAKSDATRPWHATSRRRIRLVAGLIVPLAVVWLAACGGGNGGDGGAALDPSKADQLAHVALISESDLPGSGWSVTATDEFADSELDFGNEDSAACKSLNAKMSGVTPDVDAGRAGRAQTELAKEGVIAPTIVDVSVTIFRDTHVPEKALSAYKDALSSNDFAKCLSDTIQDSFGTGPTGGSSPKLTVTEFKPSASAPQGGSAKAFDMEVSAPGLTAKFRMEFYLWRFSNAGTTIFIFGSNEEVTRDLVKAAVDKTQQNLQSAVK